MKGSKSQYQFTNAQQKMLCAPLRTYHDIQKDPNGNNSSSGEHSIDTEKSNSKDYEVSSVTWKNYSHQCKVLAFLTPECKIIMALPYHDRRILRRSSPYNIDDIESSSSQRAQFLQWSYVRDFINDENKWKLYSISSVYKDPFTRVDYPLVISNNTGPQRKSRRKGIKNRVQLTELNSEVGSSKDIENTTTTSLIEYVGPDEIAKNEVVIETSNNHGRRRNRGNKDRERKSQGKREKVVRKENVQKSRSFGNLGHFGKENNTHSIWQKVKKNDGLDLSTSQINNNNNKYTKTEDSELSTVKVSRKVKKKRNSGAQCYCVKVEGPVKKYEASSSSSNLQVYETIQSSDSILAVQITEPEKETVKHKPCFESVSQKWVPVKENGKHFHVPKFNNTVKKCISCEFEKSDFEAVNNAYKSQLISKGFENMTGHPIAEFEKFIYSASPVICKSRDLNTVCEHKIPNIPLGNIWQWYEKHGVCGLEVKSEDYEYSNRLGMDQFSFRAYFVPYLSALQLFKERKSGPTSLSLVSVFPSDETELIFEYFESEQPQQRRPLFETIKRLSSGEKPLKCRLYGDSTILESVNLHDLHPNSWFSVSWYPVYRIPDGKLRAAFLTYHSLGHLVNRGEDDSVICPVTGLLGYNCQGECWFRPRKGKDENALEVDSTEIFKERIRSLEHTASVMARGVVRIGDEIYTNRQPDYEFFLSRRC